MGKRHSSDRHSSNKRSDDTFDISSDSELLRSFIKQNTYKLAPPIVPNPPKPLKILEDRRTFHPEKHVEPKRTDGARPRQVLRAERSPSISRPHAAPHLSPRIGLAQPSKVAMCIRRKTRREVIFAKQKTRKGAAARRTRNQWSDLSC